MQWRLSLSVYESTTHYRKGRLSTQADAVSRLISAGYTTEHEEY